MANFNLQFARDGFELTMDILLNMASGTIDKSIVFSPLSVQICVALAFAGAEGETAEEIVQGMKFISKEPSEVGTCFRDMLEQYKTSEILKIANKVYVHNICKIKPEYELALKENYFTETEVVNFGDKMNAARVINSWVEQETAGKITDLIPRNCLGDDTRMVLLNAIYFKGDWKNKFDAKLTKESDFWINQEESVKVAYMYQKAKFGFGYFENLNCTALEMPYSDSELSMLVLLPDNRDGLQNLVENLRTVNLIELVNKMFTKEVMVKFPKFKIDFSVDLQDTLRKMGVNKMFDGDAEFYNMLEHPEIIYVSNVIHKACIEVNEEGTKTVAATGMVMRLSSMPYNDKECELDHPFLYIIWNRKKNVLFVGTFTNYVEAG